MSEDKTDLQEANPFVTAGSRILNKIRGGKTMEVIPPKGAPVSMPRGASGTEVATNAAKTGSGLKPVGLGTAAGAATAVGLGTYAYQTAKKDTETSSTGRTGVGMNKVMNRGETTTPPEPAKTETPKSTKMTFDQAYAKAREAAKAAGKDPNVAQFKFDRGGGEKVYQAAATKADYVPMSKQFKVDIGSTKAPETPKPAEAPKPAEPAKTSDVTPKPVKTTSVQTPVSGDQKSDLNIGDTLRGSGHSDLKLEPFKRPEIVAKANQDTNTSYESGGKKKKMSEENNPLIAMFLKLQEKNTLTPNIFEAAKKAKKDHDGDGKIESEKDEVWGSRFRAAKAAGKMEEENLDELKKPTPETAAKVVDRADNRDEWSPKAANRLYSAYKKRYEPKPETKKEVKEDIEQFDEDLATAMTLGGLAGTAVAPLVGKGVNKAMDYLEKKRMKKYSDERKAKKSVKEEQVDYSAPDRPAVTKDNKPSTPAQTNAATSGPSDADKKALDSKIKTIAKEEVSFSEAELAFFASVFEAVAPNRPEPTKGVNPTVRDTELTDETIAEGRPRKNPTPETTERDARQHIQVQAGRAAGGTVVDFKHDNGKISKLTPGMGRAITAHLNSLKPAERQEAVKRMHASPEGLKV